MSFLLDIGAFLSFRESGSLVLKIVLAKAINRTYGSFENSASGEKGKDVNA